MSYTINKMCTFKYAILHFKLLMLSHLIRSKQILSARFANNGIVVINQIAA